MAIHMTVDANRSNKNAHRSATGSDSNRRRALAAFPAALRNGLLAVCVGVALWGTHVNAGAAQSMVSVKSSTLNMRSGPGTNHPVIWQIDRGYPLRVIGRKGSWLKVRDFENDLGWVARSLTGKTPHHIVKSKTANIRSGPGTNYRIVGKADYGDLLRTLEKRGQWVKVKRVSGGKGWVSKNLLWGW